MATSSSNKPATPFDRALEQARNRKTYHSFGHEGVTATVGASGRLMQMSRHFPNQKVGFCVDNQFVPEPYFVSDRAERLHSWAADPVLTTAIDPILFPSPSWDEPKFDKYVIHRWPMFTRTRKDGLEVKIQYVASDAAIYQIFDFWHPSHSGSKNPPTLLMKDGLKIRNLDFTDPCNRYNEAKETDKEYNSELKQDCFIREHQINSPEEDPNHEKSVVLSISCFQDGKALQFVKRDTTKYHYYTIGWNELALKKFEQTGKFKVVLAYKLDLVSRGDLLPSVPKQDVSAAERQLDSAGFPCPALTGATYLHPILIRNLEHILSVCSIPVTSPAADKLSAVALTCGDIDGHRVATAASFYCFQFLLLAWKYFKSKMPPEDLREAQPHFISTMMDRIERVCNGHLIWLFGKKKPSNNLLSPHLWVNGESIDNWENNEYLPTKTLVDTPFQIIKAGDFLETFDYIEHSVKAGVRVTVTEWIRAINQKNKMGLYAFPSYKKEETNNFYFADHVLIWRAARSAERLGLREELKVLTETQSKKPSQNQRLGGRQTNNHRPGQKYRKPKFYYAEVIQSNILKRFTTENPVSKKRMIAVSRSPAQTRFLLRTKDASLFHAMGLGLFNKPGTESGFANWQNMIDVWKNTIDCQIAHEDDDDIWDEPLRFALATVVACHDKAINHRPAKDMGDHAMTVLLQSTSANGLFPGRLDENNEPALYEREVMRDNYWSGTFEVPYLLWKFLWPGKETPPKHSDGNTEQTGVCGQQPATLGANIHINSTGSAEQQTAAKITANSRGISMKRVFPFNNMVDQDNIVELTDEWLYNVPAFVVSSQKDVPGDNVKLNNDILGHDGGDAHGETNSREQALVSNPTVTEVDLDPDTDFKDKLEHEVSCDTRDEEWYDPEPIFRQLSDSEESSHSTTSTSPGFVGAVVDVPKSKHLKMKSLDWKLPIKKLTTRKSLMGRVQEGRTPENAKKRFWVFFADNPLPDGICCATSALHYTSLSYDEEKQEEQEKAEYRELDVFQKRHRSCDKFFSDDPAPISNSWTTELHLSFYRVDRTYYSCKESTKETTNKGSLCLPGLGEDDSIQLSRVAMSFRFDGDFFDRYWTSWFLVADPGTQTTEHTIENHVSALLEWGLKEKKNVDLKKQPWRQRRILELQLFDRIIYQMHSYADEILNQAQSSIKKEAKVAAETSQKSRSEADEVDYNEFIRQRKRFGKFQEALRAMQDDLNDNLTQVDRWLDREKDRQAERPRWTFNDESRYRSTISKLVVSNEHNIQDLRRSYSKIKNFNELLTKKVDTMRSDIEHRRADNIQRFTYVTVVFLPLGFATGVFSMSGVPPIRTLVYMILVAIGALLTIYVLLENMRRVEEIYRFVSQHVRSASEKPIMLMRPGLNFVTEKYNHLVKAWQPGTGRVKTPDAEEGTAEDGTHIAGHD